MSSLCPGFWLHQCSLYVWKLGVEDKVNPILQEATFILHAFGRRLRSKVKYLRCHHESERYENMMDLTLEIFGWVESLEDALTQFTTPEELDGENMYRCGRRYSSSLHALCCCGAFGYIECILFWALCGICKRSARQLFMVDDAEYEYGIISYYFKGTIISEKRKEWKSDSGEVLLDYSLRPLENIVLVHPLPMSQVMSEGAYILFYIRNVAQAMEFSDATSSGWSLSASSDEASFTTESTSDSFGTVDYTDACNADTFSSIFSNLYAPVVLVEHSVL
ncbi:hypothetical protein GH714_001903 [Hevea brasiliensis]|uniref:USP domain-containing protein n=1 Tax=Hevea brasiliensis TaxID=3981 RepID=A0A6A6KFB8_HEVBR|nr:hypothetical protein GH714_001903 [Hevea brasiliensis]